MTIDLSECPCIERHPEVCGGHWRFEGTRHPVYLLLNNLASGTPLFDYINYHEELDASKVRKALFGIQEAIYNEGVP